MAEANLHPPQQTVHPSMRYEQKREPEDIHLSEPRPRRSSAASSFHSLASSSASHFHDESPDTSAEGQNSFLAQRAALAPTSNSEGFLVGFSPTLPPALVRWADLITLLLNPAATARLPSGHLIADMADSIAARLERDPGAYPFATSPTDEQHFAAVAGQLTSSPPKTLYHAEPPSAPESELFYNPAQPRPHPLSSFPQFSTAQPPTHVPREPLPPPASTACVNPVYTVGYAEQAVSSPDEAVPVLPTPPAHLRNAAPPPPPQQQLLPPMDLNDPVSSRDFASPRMGLYGQEPGHSGYNELASISSRRGTLRQNSAAQSPYHRPAVIQTAHFSASSLHEYAGADSIQPEPSSMYYQHDEYDEPATAVPPGLMRSTNLRSASRGFKRRNFRPLNEEEETYYWSALLQTLTRIQPDPAGRTRTRPLGEIMVVFPPGSYCRVMVDDTEALPCDTRSRVNEWLRGQRCVEGCSFRFEGKRPSVIRQHVTACKARAQKLEVDPLKKLCQLQLEAQSQEVRTRQPSKLRRQSKAPRPDEDETMDRSSIFSYESYGSRCSSSAGGGNSPRPSWYSNELPGEIDDATMRLEGQEEDLVMPDSDKTPSLPPAPHAVWPQADNLAAELTATSSLVSMSRSLEGAYSSAPPGERLSTPLSAHLEVAASEAGSSFALA